MGFDNTYPKGWVRVAWAFIESICMLLYWRLVHSKTAFTLTSFFVVLTFSWFLALVLITGVDVVTKKLDRNYQWERYPIERSLLQIVFALAAPAILSLILIQFYITRSDKTAIGLGIVTTDSLLIICLLLVVNVWYVIVYFVKRIRGAESFMKEAYEAVIERAAPSPSQHMVVRYHGGEIKLNVAEDVLYFRRVNQKVNAFTIDGNRYRVSGSLKLLAEKLREENFCQINPSILLNCRIVQGYAASSERERHAWQVLFNPAYVRLVADPQDKAFLITKAHIEAFKDMVRAI